MYASRGANKHPGAHHRPPSLSPTRMDGCAILYALSCISRSRLRARSCCTFCFNSRLLISSSPIRARLSVAAAAAAGSVLPSLLCVRRPRSRFWAASSCSASFVRSVSNAAVCAAKLPTHVCPRVGPRAQATMAVQQGQRLRLLRSTTPTASHWPVAGTRQGRCVPTTGWMRGKAEAVGCAWSCGGASARGG